MTEISGLLVNIDVPNLEQAIAFYGAAFGLVPARRFGAGACEMIGWPAPVYLLQCAAGTIGAATEPRHYERHWTPVHLDIVVDDLQAALTRATAAGAIVERPSRAEIWGTIATLADPFGHGFCLIAFSAEGYDAIATGSPAA